eukprot:gene12436-12573_t
MHDICDAVAHPGFIECDDDSKRCLVLNAEAMQYKVYDLSKPWYPLLFCLSAVAVADVKISCSHLLIVREDPRPHHHQQDVFVPGQRCEAALASSPQRPGGKDYSHITGDTAAAAGSKDLVLNVLSIVNGQLLADHRVPLLAGGVKELQVLELFGTMLLMRQPLHPFMIYNVLRMNVEAVSQAEELSQVSSFLYLDPQHLFLTVTGHKLTTWNFKAQAVCCFEDHELWYPDNQQPLYLSHDWVISYCRLKGSHTLLPARGAVGAIHVSNVCTGKLVAKIEAKQPADEEDDMQQLLLDPGCCPSPDSSAMRLALADVSVVVYDDVGHAIFTGNHAGHVHKWGVGA